MKTTLTRKLAVVSVALGLGCGQLVFADNSPAVPPKEKAMKGVATSIDPADKTVLLKRFWGSKRFNVADDCKVSLQDKPVALLTDLRPGQELEINYENDRGVLVAHQIAQRDLVFTGSVKAIDPAQHALTLRHHALDKSFQIPDDCKVVLRDAKIGTLTDVQPGHRVTVTYELPKGTATAREIAQTSAMFSGALTAIDLTDRTLKARALLAAMKFNAADDCSIVIDGKPDAKLSDLKLGDRLVFSYDDVNGVNVVNRIATAEAPPESTTASSGSHSSGMPPTSGY